MEEHTDARIASRQDVGVGGLGKVRARRAELHRAILSVELALARPAARPDWLAGVSAALASLRLAFGEHVAITEGRDGLFEQILADVPRLEGAVRRLRAEHVDLHDGLSAAVVRLHKASRAPTPAAADLRRAILPLLGRFVRHRQRGADLLYEAYEVDIGGSAD